MTSLASERANGRKSREKAGRQIVLEAIDDVDSSLKFLVSKAEEG